MVFSPSILLIFRQSTSKLFCEVNKKSGVILLMNVGSKHNAALTSFKLIKMTQWKNKRLDWTIIQQIQIW